MKPISDDIDFLKFAGMQESQFIEPTSAYLDEVKERFAFGFEVKGERLPWKKTHDRVDMGRDQWAW